MQKRVFTVWNEFSLDWLCVARLTRLLLIVETLICPLQIAQVCFTAYFNSSVFQQLRWPSGIERLSLEL